MKIAIGGDHGGFDLKEKIKFSETASMLESSHNFHILFHGNTRFRYLI